MKAQFHRTVESDQPLEKGNADDVLTMVIYNSPAEYQFNRQLYGYETNNGGLYIEGTGTFFTYERTPEESIYSLEELFRHEFTHYLQGRYEVPDFGDKVRCMRMRDYLGLKKAMQSFCRCNENR